MIFPLVAFLGTGDVEVQGHQDMGALPENRVISERVFRTKIFVTFQLFENHYG